MNTNPMTPPLTDAELAAREAELHAQALAQCVKKNEDWHARNDARAFQLQTRIPNFLRDQTVPNTLAGMPAPAPVARRGPSNGVLVVVGGVITAIGALVLSRVA